MAVPTGTFTTYEVIGNREDLTNRVMDISPMDTPFVSNIARVRASHTLHEFQTDVLAAATSGNKTLEGDDATTNTATPTVRFANYAQLQDKVARVTDTQGGMNPAGREDELDYQVAKRTRELKRDVESALLGLQAADAGSALTARSLAGASAWLWDNNVEKGTAGTTPTVTSGAPTTAPTASTAGTFTEANLKSVLQACWTDGGDAQTVLMGIWNKSLASAFSGVATLYRDSQGDQPATILGAADIYISDVGKHFLVADRFCPGGTVYCLDLEYWKSAWMEGGINTVPLAKTGHSERVMIRCELTLEACAPTSSGKIETTTTS